MIVVNRTRRTALGATLLLGTLLLSACGGDAPAPAPTAPAISRLTLAPGIVALDTGATQQITATAYAADGSALAGHAFSYTSSDTSIATVSGAGMLRARHAGVATIRVASAERSTVWGTIDVTVRVPPVPPVAISLAFSGSGRGLLAATPSGLSCTSACAASVDRGSSVVVTATALPGSTFVGWSGACAGTTPTCVVIADAPRTITAQFDSVVTTYELGVAVDGSGRGAVRSTPDAIDCPGTCRRALVAGTVVTLTATPAAGSAFAGWSGDCAGLTSTCTVRMDRARDVTAAFSPVVQSYTVAVTATPIGAGTVTSSPAGIACPGTCTMAFAEGTVVTLAAAPAPGNAFVGWTGACVGAALQCAVTVRGDYVLAATFAPSGAALTVSTSGTGTGTVTSSPAGILCPVSTCVRAFPVGSTVTLTAVAGAGSAFVGWGGSGATACATPAPTCTAVIGSATTVTATFTALPQDTLRILPVQLALLTGDFSKPVNLELRHPGGPWTPVYDAVVDWTTSDARVATVVSASPLNGAQVTPVGIGSATITARFNGLVASIPVTVTRPPVWKVFVQGTPTFGVGVTMELDPYAIDSLGRQLRGRPATWSSADPSVASIAQVLPDGHALVLARAIGTTRIDVLVEGVAGTATITITPAGVLVAASGRTVAVGATLAFTATPRDAQGNTIPAPPPVWRSTNPAVATVSTDGVVTGRAPGTAFIEATIAGQTGRTVVDVVP